MALEGTIVQYPFVMGRLAIEACVLRARGGRLPSSIVAPVGVVTATNVVQATARFPRPLRPVADPLAARLGH